MPGMYAREWGASARLSVRKGFIMPDGVGPIVTGLAVVDAMGAGLVFTLCTGAGRQARRAARAEEEARQREARQRAAAQMAIVEQRRKDAAKAAAMAAHLHMHKNMNAETVTMERIDWPKRDPDPPPTASVSVPLQTRPYIRRQLST